MGFSLSLSLSVLYTGVDRTHGPGSPRRDQRGPRVPRRSYCVPRPRPSQVPRAILSPSLKSCAGWCGKSRGKDRMSPWLWDWFWALGSRTAPLGWPRSGAPVQDIAGHSLQTPAHRGAVRTSASDSWVSSPAPSRTLQEPRGLEVDLSGRTSLPAPAAIPPSTQGLDPAPRSPRSSSWGRSPPCSAWAPHGLHAPTSVGTLHCPARPRILVSAVSGTLCLRRCPLPVTGSTHTVC